MTMSIVSGPVGVDAERLHVDAALVHRPEAFGAEHERARGNARRVGSRHALADLGEGAVGVDVDDCDLLAADADFLADGLGAGVRREAHRGLPGRQRARRVQEVSAARHVDPSYGMARECPAVPATAASWPIQRPHLLR